MSRVGRWVLSMLLWVCGGTVYFLLEVGFKPGAHLLDHASFGDLAHHKRGGVKPLDLSMGSVNIPVERCGSELPWECPLWIQALTCASLVTVVELAAGLLLNVFLGLNIWDYSNLPFNLWGQICPQYAAAWWFLCLAFIPIFDWLRWAVVGGDRPKYKFF